MRSRDVRLSRYLSFVLRHDPVFAGLEMDDEGWLPLAGLVDAAVEAGHGGGLDDVLRVVRENDKQRFEVSDDGVRIRAVQGHSVDVDLGLDPSVPPSVLFHGTVARFMDAILAEGLRPMRRTYVHLSPDVETATAVGSRHGEALVLEVDAAAMVDAGYTFFEATNGVWLVADVPAEFLQLHLGAQPQ